MIKTSRKVSDALTVAELIEALSKLDPAARVTYAIPCGELGYTEQALVICSAEAFNGHVSREAASEFSVVTTANLVVLRS